MPPCQPRLTKHILLAHTSTCTRIPQRGLSADATTNDHALLHARHHAIVVRNTAVMNCSKPRRHHHYPYNDHRHHAQPWERVATPIQSLQQVSLDGVEEVVESKPYGIHVTVDEMLCVCTQDLFQDMKERQVEYVSPGSYDPTSSYLPYRRYLVDWMSDVGEQFRLHSTTIHVAILFLDRIFRARNIPRGQWQLLATACISVAAKYEEAEEHCPHIPDLLQFTKLSAAGHTSLSFREGELEVLRYLGWKLRAVPPLHVVGYFLAKGVTFQDDSWQGRPLIEKIPRYVKKYADFFCNLTLQEYAFQQYLPTHLASAVILASRVALQIEPRWRPELARLTGYDETEIMDVYQHVWSYFEEQFPGHGSRAISPRSVAAPLDMYP